MLLDLFQFVRSGLERYYRGSPTIPTKVYKSGTPKQALYTVIG